VSRGAGIVCGVSVGLAVLLSVGVAEEDVDIVKHDGEMVGPGDVVLSVSGELGRLLLAERTLLNFMTHLSGVATETMLYVDAVSGTGAKIRDTRKTTPGMRELEKYAVRCGGGENHRMGLGDMALIKDNHIVASGSITKSVEIIRSLHPGVEIEVECDYIDQVVEAMTTGVTLILLDNMNTDEIREAVHIRTKFPNAKLEASGGVSLSNVRDIALCGVDYIAVGALTHSSPVLDLGFDLRAV
jgi:nicotinate-nucleotide pyrophosphorylase (carboxylating)